jgi:selenocysteine lyase/cysteine desulfurase
VRPAGNHPPGHRFETGTLSHEALPGFVAAVGYLESLGSDDADRLGSAYQAIAAHELELAETFLARLREVPGWRLLGIQDADPGRRVPTSTCSATARRRTSGPGARPARLLHLERQLLRAQPGPRARPG